MYTCERLRGGRGRSAVILVRPVGWMCTWSLSAHQTWNVGYTGGVYIIRTDVDVPVDVNACGLWSTPFGPLARAHPSATSSVYMHRDRIPSSRPINSIPPFPIILIDSCPSPPHAHVHSSDRRRVTFAPRACGLHSRLHIRIRIRIPGFDILSLSFRSRMHSWS